MAECEEEAALPFIQYVEGKLEVDKHAVSVLSSMKGKIAVVCVAGPYRTGKSFLLNRLIGRQHGFKVGGSVNSCTKGIWLWGEGICEEGSEHRTIFLDSEGLGSIEQSATFDVQIFSLALLLSSLFILNTQGTINEAALEQMELVVECTRAIQAQESKRAEAPDEAYRGGDLAPHFPDFLWVLRDFMLELADTSGSSMTAKQYLEKCLEDQPGNRKRLMEKNRIRQTLRTVFPRRDCETLVRPVGDERQLQKLSELPYDSLREEFRDQMDRLRIKVLRAAPLKAVDGVLLNGAALVRLAEAYCNVLNSGAAPTVRTAWQSVVEMQLRDGMEAGVSCFERRLQHAFASDSVCFNQEDLDSLLQQVENECVGLILEVIVGDEAFKQGAMQSFRSKVQPAKCGWVKHNSERGRVLGRQLMEQLWKTAGLETKIQKCEATPEAGLLSEVEALIGHALNVLPGPTVVREETCRVFLQFLFGVSSKALFSALTKHQAKITALVQEVDDLRKAAIESAQIRSREREETAAELGRLQGELALTGARLQDEKTQREQVELKLSEIRGSLVQVETQKAELASKLAVEEATRLRIEAEAKKKKEKLQGRITELTESLNAARDQVKAAEGTLERVRTQNRAEVDVLKQSAESTNQALHDANVYITELEAQAKDRDAELLEMDSSVKQAATTSKQLEEKLCSLREELAAKTKIGITLEARASTAEQLSVKLQEAFAAEKAKVEATRVVEEEQLTQIRVGAQERELLAAKTEELKQQYEREQSELNEKLTQLENGRTELRAALQAVEEQKQTIRKLEQALAADELAGKKKEEEAKANQLETERALRTISDLREAEARLNGQISELKVQSMQHVQNFNALVTEKQAQAQALEMETSKLKELTEAEVARAAAGLALQKELTELRLKEQELKERVKQLESLATKKTEDKQPDQEAEDPKRHLQQEQEKHKAVQAQLEKEVQELRKNESCKKLADELREQLAAAQSETQTSSQRCTELVTLNESLEQEVEQLRAEIARPKQATPSLSQQLTAEVASINELKEEEELLSARQSASYQILLDKVERCKSLGLAGSKRTCSEADLKMFKIPQTKQPQRPANKENISPSSNRRTSVFSISATPQSPGGCTGIRQVNGWLTSPSRQV